VSTPAQSREFLKDMVKRQSVADELKVQHELARSRRRQSALLAGVGGAGGLTKMNKHEESAKFLASSFPRDEQQVGRQSRLPRLSEGKDAGFAESGLLKTFECPMAKYHLFRFVVGVCLSAPYAMMFAAITDTLTHLSPTISSVLMTGFVLLLTQQSFDALGRFLAEISGQDSIPRAVCFGTIVSQLLVISGGFYRTVPRFLSFISAIGPIRYSFSAIVKVCFSASDSFWCYSDRTMALRGYTWCSTELSGTVSDLKSRGINVIDSFEEPGAWMDVLKLLGIIFSLRVVCYLVAMAKSFMKKEDDDF
jgi:hypothetical protein